jgi:hypothetical protein
MRADIAFWLRWWDLCASLVAPTIGDGVAAAMPERVAELRGVLDRHLVDTKAVLPAPNPTYRPDASGRIGD